MTTTTTVTVTGYWLDEPHQECTYQVALGSWDGNHDAADEAIFYYMDGEPLNVGDVIAGDFRVTSIDV